MPEPTFWWPLELSVRETEAVETLRGDLLRQPPQLDVAAVERVSGQLALLMAHSLEEIVERDGLPHLCHVFNGWGNGLFRGRPLTAELEPFVHRGPDGSPYSGPMLLQCDPEGDYHPWQSLAYAVMAGVEPEELLFEDASGGATLLQLAQNSRALGTDKGIELGHLLFAAAQLGGEAKEGVFFLEGEEYDLRSLVDLAIEAHHFGGFEVCRKFHLTEGLCAVAALVPGFEEERSKAEGFLVGQLEMLLLLGVILQQARQLLETGSPVAEDSLLKELRDTLIVDEYLENHCYYAGHLIELAGFAEAMGYSIQPEHRGAMALVLNELNALLPEILTELSFLDCFLHLGHYRRAMTLQLEVARAQRENRQVEGADLGRFEVDFDALANQPPLARASSSPEALASGVYAVAPPTVTIRPRFAAIVNHYAVQARQGLGPRGHLGHFRRIGPAAWPRAVHYELLDYGDQVGTEIHLESDAVRSLAPVLRSFTDTVKDKFQGRAVEWEPGWSRNRGRLRVLFEEDSPAEEVAEAMAALVDHTLPILDREGGGLWGSIVEGRGAAS